MVIVKQQKQKREVQIDRLLGLTSAAGLCRWSMAFCLWLAQFHPYTASHLYMESIMKIFMSVAIRRKDRNFPSIRFTLEKFYTWTNFLVFAVCRLRKLFKVFLFTSDKALTWYERDKNFCIEGRASDSFSSRFQSVYRSKKNNKNINIMWLW